MLKGILALNGEVPIKGPQVSLPLWCQIGEPGMGHFWCVHSGLSRKQARLTGCLEYLGVVGWSCSGSHGISQKATWECGGGRQRPASPKQVPFSCWPAAWPRAFSFQTPQ